ncbi:MAG: OsmC family protein [Ekhidna sp.]|uniref:OsmC family protein n=1 Tax=Ekhidna sp. TaxID=2608089 RepID=UPI0032EBF98E
MSKELKFSVSSVSESRAKTRIQTRGFDLTVDEPESLGGTNQAPNPIEYILAGYAGCINVVAHIIAEELDFYLENLKINIDGFLNPNRLFGKSLDERAGYKQIDVRLETTSEIDPELKKKWLAEISHRCPVNDNLTNATPISFSIN